MKIIFFSISIYAFSYNMHRYLGDNLCKLLEKDGNTGINNTLQEPCSEASLWADKVKSEQKYKWTSKLHYINLYECNAKIDEDYIQKECKEEKCIVPAIIKSFNKEYPLNKEENLKFLIHIAQDFFQPLHIHGAYGGGNGYMITRNKKGKNKTMNLHQFFDGELFEHFVKKENYKPVINHCVNYDYNIKSVVYKRIKKSMDIACYFYTKLSGKRYIIFEDFYERDVIRQVLDDYFYFSYNMFFSFFNFINLK